MKRHILYILAFIVSVGMMMTFGSCNKDNNSQNLIGTWRVYIEQDKQEKLEKSFFDITFNADGKGVVFSSADEESASFYYIFNEKESYVTFIQIYNSNYNDYALYYIYEIWMYFHYKCGSKAPATIYGVQFNGVTLELTDSNGMTVSFTKQQTT